ncbi:prolyl oligopeptidase family serine peptidase [Tomitella biformata]|uniref:prolyl oligopeptidase family serine peptidase n=1 Tax=Tomitella biformata TaxID=630403 RepID=UPI0004655F28|nr:prolyl oligopeptidase family serine peptidase [Tomitella biformata]
MTENIDSHLWLEDVTGNAALDWVRARSETTRERWAASEDFAELESKILGILDTDARIAYPRRRGAHLYNFWRDATHVRGLWRRTTLESYRTDAPEWEVLIDLDALAEAEGENWVWSGGAVLRVIDDGAPIFPRALVSLSRGGADAVVVREFDMDAKTFLSPEAGGFSIPEAKSQVSWIDIDTIYVGSDFGPGSLTESGYPRQAKRWRRGQALTDAQLVYEGVAADVAVSVTFDNTPGFERHVVDRAVDFFTSRRFLLDAQDQPEELDVPGDAQVSLFREQLLVFTRSPWSVGGAEHPSGTLLSVGLDEYLGGARDLEVVFAPDAHRSLEDYSFTDNHLVLTVLDDVRTELLVAEPGSWATRPLAGLPDNSTISVIGTDADFSDEVFLNASGFLQPSTLLHGDTTASGVAPLKQAPAFFDADGLTVDQFFATSDDGTAVPYFVVHRSVPHGAATTPGPTLLYGYGGFENSMTPAYSGILGEAWLSRGGTYVLANIRGGGEYGPEWHTQAVKAGRHKVHEDFAAVARDLVDRGITTASQLGAQGGSNGGLLMGIMLTKYPELFGALVCQVPLLDMRRYHLLLAGASWVAEYGDPDDSAEWAFISEYSPYQNVQADGVYPPTLITTSTRDDRVHPGHARKMAALLEELGHPVTYYENIEGGHGGAADNAQQAFKSALAYQFLWGQLGG